MKICAYCEGHATATIPAIPDRVCLTHAQEFWTGLLTYVKDQAKLTEQHETSCVCGMCDDSATHESESVAQRLVAPPFTATWRDLQIQ